MTRHLLRPLLPLIFWAMIALISVNVAGEAQPRKEDLNVELVAPFSITTPKFTSSLHLSNRSQTSVAIVVRRNSLLGEEVGRMRVQVDASTSCTISLDKLSSSEREFGDLGPVFVSIQKRFLHSIDGNLIIASR